MKFLVVDDSAIIRQKIINTFIGYDIQFDQAADGAEALNFLEVLATDYDLITLDWNMPNVTGIEVSIGIFAVTEIATGGLFALAVPVMSSEMVAEPVSPRLSVALNTKLSAPTTPRFG